ncbi:MAG: nucleoside-triphosphatase [Bradymonadaceae bacterium]
MPTNLLLTGRPGIGKTTAAESIRDALADRDWSLQGFVTREIRDDGSRVGFRMIPVDGEETTFAHVDLPPPRISTYGVDLEALEAVLGETLDPEAEIDAYIVDEIGKMEVMSDKFIDAMEALLDNDRPVVATVGTSDRGLMGEVKKRDDVDLWKITTENRDGIVDEAVEWLT